MRGIIRDAPAGLPSPGRDRHEGRTPGRQGYRDGMNVEERVQALFDLPPDEFTPARDELARELRDAGEREAAAEVKKRKRPSVAAWALNSLVRTHRDEVDKLLAVGERLREAQRSVLEGGDREPMHQASAARRDLIDGLMDRAREVLEGAGHAASRTHLDRVEGSLTAATLTEEAAEELRGGTLERELEPPKGLEALGVWEMAEPTPLAPRSERAERREAEAAKAEEEAQAAADEAKRLAKEADRVEREAAEARRAAKKAATVADRARRRAEDLRRRARGR